LVDDSLTAFEKKIDRIIEIKKYVNLRLYIYQIEEAKSEPLIRFIVISASEREALDLVKKECDKQEILGWKVQKIGIATDDYYGPTILMKNI
jgi:hypothetical protein